VSRMIFLLEEPSMKEFLESFLPRAIPDLNFLCVWHEGKRDLEKSIPRKLRGWKEPGAHFVIVRDNDGAPCKRVKAKLVKLCKQGGRPTTLVRIACQELESWYLGEPDALAAAFGDDKLRDLAVKARYRDPDAVARPSDEMQRLVPQFQKIDAARRMGAALTVSGSASRSHSFQVFLASVRQLAESTDFA